DQTIGSGDHDSHQTTVPSFLPGVRESRTSGGQPASVLGLEVVAVGPAHHALPPGAVRDEPVHRLIDPGLEGVTGRPPEFGPRLGGIDGVTTVMTEAVLDVPDERFALAGELEHGPDDLEVGALGVATDVVDL